MAKKITRTDNPGKEKMNTIKKKSSTSAAKSTKISSTSKGASAKSKIKSKQKSTGSKATKTSLSKIRKELAPYFEVANNRAKAIQERGIKTRAIYDAEESLTKRGKERYSEGGDLFNIDAYHYAELQREATRVKNFLNDESSNPSDFDLRKAKNDEKFGNMIDRKYYAMYGVNYDVSRLSEGQAKLLFSAYRRLEEANAALMQGRTGYGSDTLINDLLDLMIGDGKVSCDESDEELLARMIESGQQLITEWDKEAGERASRDASTPNWDYGILADVDNISKEDFLRRYGK